MRHENGKGKIKKWRHGPKTGEHKLPLHIMSILYLVCDISLLSPPDDSLITLRSFDQYRIPIGRLAKPLRLVNKKRVAKLEESTI